MSDLIDEGTGPALVFLHGAGVDHTLWEPQIAAFSATHRVIVPNLPGHGGVPAVKTVEQIADHIRALLLERGIRRYAIIGLSLGGMVALDMAGRWPEDVTHLVMIESIPNVTDNRALLLIGQAFVGLFRVISPKLLVLLPARQLGAETPDAAQYLKRVLAQQTAQENHAVLQAALAYDGRPHLHGLSMPTLIMVGEKNPATHKRSKAMAESIKQCPFVVIPAAGHIANRDAPEFVNTVLRSFLDAPPSVCRGQEFERPL